MRRASPILVAFAILLFAAPTPAQAEPRWQIGIAGQTSWDELFTVVELLRVNYDVPIRASECLVGHPCIYISHYSSKDGRAGLAWARAGQRGSTNIAFNNAYDRGSSYRMEVLFHEFGHALGLSEHETTCNSSMQARVAMCGYHMVGYTPEQQERLRKIWG